MKTKLAFIAALFYTFLIFVFVSSVSGQWVSQVNPLGSGQNAMTGKIQYISSTEGWISLGNGKLLHSTNGGNNWLVVNPEPVDTLFSWSDPALSMSFINPSTGWIIRTKGTQTNFRGAVVYKTVNGGVNWSKVTIPNYDAGIYIQFVDESYGWIILFNSGYTGGGLFRTTNGGTNWNAINTPVGGFPFFINSNTGWLMPVMPQGAGTSSDSIRKTTNGGVNWTAPWGTNSQVIFNAIHFSDVNNGCAVGGSGLILKTTNGGNSWTYYTMIAGTPFYNISAVFFLNANTGWVGAKHYNTGAAVIIYTSNGGTSWTFQPTPINTPPENNKIFSVHFSDASNGGFTADYGKICRTSNGGVRVTNISTEIPSAFSLSQNYPNPFNPATKIKFSVPKVRHLFGGSSSSVTIGNPVKLIVYDIMGREVQTIVNEALQPGTYEVTFDGSMQTSGVYFYKLQSSDFTETKRMLLVK